MVSCFALSSPLIALHVFWLPYITVAEFCWSPRPMPYGSHTMFCGRLRQLAKFESPQLTAAKVEGA